MYIPKTKTENVQAKLFKTSIASDNSLMLDLNKVSKEQKQKKNTIFMGDLTIADHQDTIAGKRAEAQKKAMKSILDQFSNDRTTDDSIEECSRQQTQLTNEALSYQKEIDHTKQLRTDLKESYNIDDNSEEQKNLELLEKSMDTTKTLSDEDMKQLECMGPLTEYQKSALRLDAAEQVWIKRYENAKNGAANAGKTVDSIKLETLKHHGMTDAQKEAEKIMKSAIDEIIGGLTEEAKESTDQEMEKIEKDAEKQAEEKAEKEEQIEKQKEKAETQEGVKSFQTDVEVGQIQNVAVDADKLIEEIKNFINKNNILDEDAKGILVDTQL